MPTLRQSANLSRTQIMSRTFPVHCHELNSIKATQTGLSQTCHKLCRNHLNMSRWFSVRDFHDLCLRLTPRGSFGESQSNRIWALRTCKNVVTTHKIQQQLLLLVVAEMKRR